MMEGVREVSFKVRMPQVGDALPSDAIWNESGDTVGYYDGDGDLKLFGFGYDEELAKQFGLPATVSRGYTIRAVTA
jgi:hypothetical protein